MAISFGAEPGLLKLIVPTHGNGTWIGTKAIEYIPKTGDPSRFIAGSKELPKQFALHRKMGDQIVTKKMLLVR